MGLFMVVILYINCVFLVVIMFLLFGQNINLDGCALFMLLLLFIAGSWSRSWIVSSETVHVLVLMEESGS